MDPTSAQTTTTSSATPEPRRGFLTGTALRVVAWVVTIQVALQSLLAGPLLATAEATSTEQADRDPQPLPRVPEQLTYGSDSEQLRGPTEQNTNPNPLVEGPTIQLAGVHAKVRREGYRKHQRA